MTVVNLSEYRKEKTSNATHDILTKVSNDYEYSMKDYTIGAENFEIAADVALIKFLMRGAAHRVTGESHPSQLLLDSIHKNLQ